MIAPQKKNEEHIQYDFHLVQIFKKHAKKHSHRFFFSLLPQTVLKVSHAESLLLRTNT